MNQLNYNAPEKSQATKELLDYSAVLCMTEHL